MEIDTDPLEGSSYDLGVTVKAEIKEEEEDDHYNTIRRVSNRVSWRQLKILWEFLNSNKSIATAYNRSLQDKEYSRKKWKEVTEILNAQRDGANKDCAGWTKYWIDYKAKLKKRVAVLRASQVHNGGGPSTEKPFNDLEEKFLQILGEDVGQGLPGEPSEIPPTNVDMHESPPSESPSVPSIVDLTAPIPAQDPLVLEPLPQSPPLEPPLQDPLSCSPSRSPSTPRHATPPADGSPRVRRRRKREPPMSQEAARRALVRSSQMHAEAAVRNAEASERNAEASVRTAEALERIARALLELAQCVQTNQEPIEFNSTDAMLDPKTGHMICLHCLEDFDSNLLSDHMMNAHNYRRVLFKCHICQNTFQERKLLMIHRQECQPEQKVRKRKTFQQIMREVEAKYFMEEQEDLLEPVACPICLLELPKYCLKEHLLNEHSKPDVILTCGRCNRNFKSKLTLREHVKLVHEAIEDSEECELCGQKFRSLKYLSNHKRNVHPSGNKIHKCMVCGKEFKSRLCLHQHSKYVHPPESASVECPHCPNKMFKSRINLTQHLKVAHGWKRK